MVPVSQSTRSRQSLQSHNCQESDPAFRSALQSRPAHTVQGNRSRCLCLLELGSSFFVTISIKELTSLPRCFCVCLPATEGASIAVFGLHSDIIQSEDKREAVRNLNWSIIRVCRQINFRKHAGFGVGAFVCACLSTRPPRSIHSRLLSMGFHWSNSQSLATTELTLTAALLHEHFFASRVHCLDRATSHHSCTMQLMC